MLSLRAARRPARLGPSVGAEGLVENVARPGAREVEPAALTSERDSRFLEAVISRGLPTSYRTESQAERHPDMVQPAEPVAEETVPEKDDEPVELPTTTVDEAAPSTEEQTLPAGLPSPLRQDLETAGRMGAHPALPAAVRRRSVTQLETLRVVPAPACRPAKL